MDANLHGIHCPDEGDEQEFRMEDSLLRKRGGKTMELDSEALDEDPRGLQGKPAERFLAKMARMVMVLATVLSLMSVFWYAAPEQRVQMSQRESVKQQQQQQQQQQMNVGGNSRQREDEMGDESPWEEKQAAVRDAFIHAWTGYKTFAWGKDTLHPVSKKGSDDFLGMAISIIDSMDTALIMGLDEVFEEQYAWVVKNLKFESQEDINVFETTIRIMGGLLSAYALSGRQPLVDLSQELGNRLLPAFETETGIPYGTIGFRSGKKYNPAWVKHASSVAEAGTLLVEFRYLSYVTGDMAFRDAVDKVERFFEKKMFDEKDKTSLEGLFPMFIHPESGEVQSTPMITFGARGDSLYEYFLKGYLQTNQTEDWLLEMYDQAMVGMTNNLLQETKGPKRYTYVAELDMNNPKNPVPKMDHLVCFLPGLLALGSKNGAGAYALPRSKWSHMAMAERLMRTCYEMYSTMPLGLAPEIAHFGQAGKPELIAKGGAHHCLLRPETVESLFVMWRTTKNPIYREWGWEIFSKINSNAKVESGGFSGIKDVTANSAALNDKMDSFFLAETLKYLYLLFSPDSVIPLDRFVLNTEAHPLPIFEFK